jgi:N-acetylmuramoyl-L-alanine amidase
MSLRARWLLLSLFGLSCIAGPAQADQLQSWRFDRTRNRLEFKTDEAVQPTAQLVFNPTRVVVDLPGIRLGRPQLTENVGGAVRSYRLGQFNPTTARIVIELAPGYTLDPNAVRVRGITNSSWVIELPQPQLESTSPSPTNPPINPGTSPPGTSAPIVPSAATRIEELRQTGDGLFLRTSGQPPSPRVRRSRDQQTIDIDISNATLNAPTIPQPIAATDLGIDQVIISQVQQTPPLVRISLRVPKNSPNWRATASNLGGIVLLPESRPEPSSPSTSPPSSSVGSPASVQVISYDYQNNQLLIQVDRQVAYSLSKQGIESRIIISPAKLAAGTTAPRMSNDAPLRQIQVRQDGPQSVSISATPNSGYQVGSLRFLNPQLLALDVFLTGGTPSIPPGTRPLPLPRPGSPSTTPSIIVEPPVSRPTFPSPTPRPTFPLPGRPLPGNSSELPTPSGRNIVVLDPGHGGPDPGAVGINNIYEKEIVLDIGTQVARLLEQQGVTVIMTRSSDIDLDLQPRVDIAERANATVFVSLHSNAISLSRPDVNGLETYYYDSGLGLAQSVHQSILEDVPIADRRVRQARFFVIRKTSMPAILIETGFVTGADDARNFQNPSFRRAMANGIARGILRYLR